MRSPGPRGPGLPLLLLLALAGPLATDAAGAGAAPVLQRSPEAARLELWIRRHEAAHRAAAAGQLRLAPAGPAARALLPARPSALSSALQVAPKPGEPVPIPGGIVVGDTLFHVFVPGPPELGFQGEDVEPSTITNYRGFTAISYLVGTARGSDGITYDMFNDMRVMSGTYVSAGGSLSRGTFVLI